MFIFSAMNFAVSDVLIVEGAPYKLNLVAPYKLQVTSKRISYAACLQLTSRAASICWP